MTTWDDSLGASVQQAVVDFTGAGDNTIISGVLGQKIKVLQFFIVIAAATDLIYKSGSTALTGTMTYAGGGAHVQDFIQLPITLASGDSFVVNNSAGVQIGGMIWYILR